MPDAVRRIPSTRCGRSGGRRSKPSEGAARIPGGGQRVPGPCPARDASLPAATTEDQPHANRSDPANRKAGVRRAAENPSPRRASATARSPWGPCGRAARSASALLVSIRSMKLSSARSVSRPTRHRAATTSGSVRRIPGTGCCRNRVIRIPANRTDRLRHRLLTAEIPRSGVPGGTDPDAARAGNRPNLVRRYHRRLCGGDGAPGTARTTAGPPPCGDGPAAYTIRPGRLSDAAPGARSASGTG